MSEGGCGVSLKQALADRDAELKEAARGFAALTEPNRLTTDPTLRKSIPLATGLLDYFPDALAAVAELSKIGNDQHNPGEPMHWARGKSMDHADCILRHAVDRGKSYTDASGRMVRHSTALAWRALANLQVELEQDLGLPPPRGAK